MGNFIQERHEPYQNVNDFYKTIQRDDYIWSVAVERKSGMTSLNPFLHIIHDLLQVLQELLFIVHPFETTTLNVPTESKTCNTDVSRADGYRIGKTKG